MERGVRPTVVPAVSTAILPCAAMHPHNRLCTVQVWATFLDAFRRAFPMYFAYNVVPSVVLRLKRFLKNPAASLVRSTAGAARSTSFLASFVAIYMAVICGQVRGWMCALDAVQHSPPAPFASLLLLLLLLLLLPLC